MSVLTHQGILPDNSDKDDVYAIINNATVGGIANADINASAAIVDTKLATIVTASKINLSALTITDQAKGDILFSEDGVTFARLPIGSTGQVLRGGVLLDMMEYATNSDASTAYVSSGDTYLNSGGTVTDNGANKVHTFTSSGTFSVVGTGTVKLLVVGGGANSPGTGVGGGAGQVTYNASFAVSTGDYAVTINGANGSSVFGTVTAATGSGGTSGNGYTQGSRASGTYGAANGGGGGSAGVGGNAYTIGDWVVGGNAGVGTINNITGTNIIYASGGSGGLDGGGSNYAGIEGARIYGDGQGSTAVKWGGGSVNPNNALSGVVIVSCVVADFSSLGVYSESTIKTQGTYSLKVIASKTTSLARTLTRTISPAIDLTGVKYIKFDIRSSRIGSNIKLGIHDTGGTTTELTPEIFTADNWQTVTWDISAVSDANKNAIDKIVLTVVNADDVNVFYLDNSYSSYLRWVTP